MKELIKELIKKFIKRLITLCDYAVITFAAGFFFGLGAYYALNYVDIKGNANIEVECVKGEGDD